MTSVLVDTNILFVSPSLASAPWHSFQQHKASWQVEIVVPEVVLMETVNLVRKEWQARQNKLLGLSVGEFGLADDIQRMIGLIQERIDSYEHDLRHRLEEVGARIAPTPPVDHLEIARRASSGTAPYQSRDKDGYRDTLIWLTLLAEAEGTADDFWFVSDNSQDFGPQAPNWTGEKEGSRSDCPILFHSELRKELAGRGLEERVKYVTSLQILEQHLASLHAPIDADELQSLVASIDFDHLNSELDRLARDTRVSPSQAALSPNSVEAVVHSLRTHDADWKFSDAAHRGKGHWTTHFTVDTEIELLVLGSTGESSVVTKTLRLSGSADFKEPSELTTLEVLSIESTPTDPNRALWEGTPFGSFLSSPVADFLKTYNTGSLDAIRATLTPSSTVADFLKTYNTGSLDAIRATLTPSSTVADFLKTYNTGSLDAIRATLTQSTGLTDFLKTYNTGSLDAIRAAIKQSTGLTDQITESTASQTPPQQPKDHPIEATGDAETSPPAATSGGAEELGGPESSPSADEDDGGATPPSRED